MLLGCHGVKEKVFENIYKDKKVLITGNTGFKGSWLTIWLLKLGAKVSGLSNNIPTNPSMFEELNLENKINFYNVDITNFKMVNDVIRTLKPDFIFHLAAQPLVSVSYEDPLETIKTNVVGTTNILEGIRNLNKPCVAVIITSDKCYDNIEWEWGYKETDYLGGKDIYSGSKGAAELIVKSYFHSFFNNKKSNLKVATARAGNVIGGGDWAKNRIVPDCMRSWNNNTSVKIRSPQSTRPWQHVLEPLSGYLNLGLELYKNIHLNGESFNFGPDSKNSFTVEHVLKSLMQTWNLDDPSKFYKIIDNNFFHEAGLLKLNCDKALYHLKWLPVLNFNKVIEFTGHWYVEYYKKSKNMFDYTTNQLKQYESHAKEKNIKWSN